jgi:hypothetical protein
MYPYLVSLRQAHVELVDAIRGGQHSQDELREITGMTRADDMFPAWGCTSRPATGTCQLCLGLAPRRLPCCV